ncbi:translational GTPase TypA [Phycisphaera mikurensis]|uniref:Large ribosomal subunit assembly factor BipA n=1 Tax=Phycisphaera mikurensis (strain NBRC 102666 / KCTC 22515 / FYK2301M01) TaxID=1142394 RepID=I0IIS6_PHYMF|nr:translational GTPase TypA [Phycisphaera mikurensis]MBB6442689.1 GTP-binding protein [Phycisphaera mikurensis]BAM05164.1 GTP-binding protein TypA [Phycisphaera mikurensis NBRC 102666]
MDLRNVAIIAHVDHGKTTLTDQLLYQSGQFRDAELDKLAGGQHNLVMDTGDLERERGITITAKNCSVVYAPPAPEGEPAKEPVKINLIDTPGHADFGGEVERVLSMADGVLLVVDAAEGPMPQTRFVLGKALGHGLKPVVVVNKVDKPDARPDWVVDQVFDLLAALEADDDALDFPIIYASAKNGWADHALDGPRRNMQPLFETIVEDVPAPKVENPDPDAPLQLMVTSLAFSEYTGRIAIGRVHRGTMTPGTTVSIVNRAGKVSRQKTARVEVFSGLGRAEADAVTAGDLCAISGLDPIDIGDTVCALDAPEALPPVAIDEPTVTMTFRVNDSPFAGQEGKFVTSRQVGDRLQRELQSNVALRVEPGESPEQFEVSGRGLMHLGVLIETMRREGYELQIGMPRVIFKEIDGKRHEPIEELVVECPAENQSDVLSLVSNRRAEMDRMDDRGSDGQYVHIVFSIPARGLLGLRTRMLTATAGKAIVHHTFLRYEPMRGDIPKRTAGVIVSSERGAVSSYALDGLYDRGFFFVEVGEQVYVGQVIGEHCKDNDIVANPCKTKQQTAVRTRGGKDANLQVRPARKMSLEQCLEYIGPDEYVEVTPESIRLRKKILEESHRRREDRKLAQMTA